MAALDTAITQIDTLLAAIALDQAKGVLKPAAPTAKGGAAAAGDGAPEQPQQAGKKKEKKGGKVKEKQAAGSEGAAKPASTGAGAATDTFSLADLRVAVVLEVGEVANSEKLLKCRVRVGSEEVRHVVAGLKLHVPMDQLAGSLVVTICNLKPKKLAGEASEAMILAATSSDGGLVLPIVPPVGATAGDQLHLEGLEPSTSVAKVLKTDPWTRLVEGLKVEGGKACFHGTPLCASGAFITVPPNMPDGGTIR